MQLLEPSTREPLSSAHRGEAIASVRTLSAEQISCLRKFLLFSGVLTLALILPLWQALYFVATTQFYNHILLVPFISLYLTWKNPAILAANWKSAPLLGGGLFLFGAFVLGYALLNSWPVKTSDRHSLVILGYLSFLAGGGFLFFGRQGMKSAAFPAAYLVFAIPLPFFLMEWIQIQLQYASAEAAYWMLSLAQIPFLRWGAIDFQLSSTPIRVAEECSGFNSSFVLFMVSVLAGQMFLKSPWKKAMLVAAVIPLAIVRNGFRITTIAWLCTEYGPHMIHSIIHKRGGPLFFGLSLIPFLALLWFLRHRETKQRHQNSLIS